VLENHHWRSAIGCLLESNVAEQLGACKLELEQQISSLILATDITRQQEFLSRFKVMNIAYSFVMCIIWLSTRFWDLMLVAWEIDTEVLEKFAFSKFRVDV
jgi:hypothetical protein